MTADNLEQGDVCDAYVPAHLQDSEVLRSVIGAPVDDSKKTHDPLCRQRYQQWETYGYCPDCDLINKVMVRERQKRSGEIQ